MLPATDLGNQLEADHEKTETIVRSGPWAGFEGTEPPSVSQEIPVQCGPLSLVEIQRGSVIIGREPPSVAPPVSVMP